MNRHLLRLEIQLTKATTETANSLLTSNTFWTFIAACITFALTQIPIVATIPTIGPWVQAHSTQITLSLSMVYKIISVGLAQWTSAAPKSPEARCVSKCRKRKIK